MTLDGLLTFLALVIAALTLMPAVRRLQLRVVMRRFIPWLVAAGAATLYFEFFDLLAPNCPARFGSMCDVLYLSEDGPLSPQQAAFLVVLGWMLLAGTRFWRARVTASTMPVLERLVEELAEQRRFSELLDVVGPNLSIINDCAARRLSFQVRHDRYAPDRLAPGQGQFLAALAGEQLPRPRLRDRTRVAWFRAMARVLPSGQRAEAAAEDIMRLLLRKREVVQFIAEYRPAFGARLLQLEHFGVSDFSDVFHDLLIRRTDSVLYAELENNQNLARCGYVLQEENVVLRATLEDASIAERLAVYSPIGEFVLGHLNPANDAAYTMSLNEPHDNHWQQYGRWRDPTFATIRFFDIMVQAAACQGVQWHMWLYYMPHITDRLIEIYDQTNDRVEEFAEWPTRAAYLLYAIFSATRDWVRIIRYLPDDSPHRLIQNERVDNENGNIPKSAALALGRCLRSVILCDRIRPRFKRYLLEVSIGSFDELAKAGAEGQLRTVAIRSLAQGGVLPGGPEYEAALRELYEEVDKPWRQDWDDFRDAIANP